MLTQRFKVLRFEDKFEMAQKYFLVVSSWYNIKLTKRQVEIAAFALVKGNISYRSIRQEFCSKVGTTVSTINNLVPGLKELGILVKDKSKRIIKINPQLHVNLEEPITIQLPFELKTSGS